MEKTFLLVVFSLLIGCTKEISVDIPQSREVTVVNSVFLPDSTFIVSLTKTQGIFDNSQVEPISNAEVQLYQNGTIADTLIFENGLFVSDIRATVAKDYRLRVAISGLEDIEAMDRIPLLPELIGTSFRDSVYAGSEGDVWSQASITISDRPNEANYYELIIKQNYRDSKTIDVANSIFGTASVPVIYDFETNDLVLVNEGQLGFFSFTNPVFSDKLFDGQTYTMKVNYGPKILFSESDGDFNNYDFVVVLRSISENYYNHRKSLTAHLENQESDIWDGTGEPVQMFTNIENGYGIFAGYSQVTDTIFKEDN